MPMPQLISRSLFLVLMASMVARTVETDFATSVSFSSRESNLVSKNL